MEPGAFPLIAKLEAAVGWLIPAACREEVLGDLRERYRSRPQYLLEAACVVPFVIWSRARRTADLVLVLVEWLSIYGMMVFATWCLDRGALYETWNYLRLAVPPAIILAVMIHLDVYADPRKRRFDPVLGPALGFSFTAALATTELVRLPHFALILGGFAGTLIVTCLRVMFPPAADQPLVARAPAFWQRVELVRSQSLALFCFQALVFVAVLFAVLFIRS